MEKVRLGRTNLMVSRVGFGGIPIQRLSEEEAVTVVKRCLDLGITFIDTAAAYSTSEGCIGKAIAGRREGLVLATKSQARSREGVESHLKQSLKQLGVESIDLYQFHNVGPDAYARIVASNGPLALIQEAKRAGVVKHIGISTHLLDMAKTLVRSGLFETVMFPFNFITSEPADELLPLAREHDVGFIAMKPLGGGMLQNATLCIKYLLQFPDVVPIPGIEKPAEIEEIVRLVEGHRQITEAERNEMQRIKSELGPQFCRRCDYCQPCKEGITISSVMTFDQLARRLPPARLYSKDSPFGSEIEKAVNCTRCGDCEERCPFKLPIRDILYERVSLFQAEKKKYLERVTARPD